MTELLGHASARYRRLSKLAPIGNAWAAVRRRHSGIELFQPDGYHPTLAGSYLSALVLYEAIYGRSPAEVTFVPPGLDPGWAESLRNTAAG